MTEGGHPTGTFDFRTLDFDRLWERRARTTEVERRIVEETLRVRDARQVLEIGPGSGRLAGVLIDAAPSYAGVDVTLEFLPRLRARWPDRPVWIGGDLARLPFRDGTFTGAVAVRVYNFLVDPATALRELYRVLVPGGWLVLSYFSSPSLAEAWDVLARRVRHPGERFPKPAPRERPSRREFDALARRIGFRVAAERGVGLEDLRALGWIPTGVFLGLSRSIGGSGVLPHHFVELRKPGPAPAECPALATSLSCPDCRAPLALDARHLPTSARCAGCGRPWATLDGVVDLRPVVSSPPSTSGELVPIRAR